MKTCSLLLLTTLVAVGCNRQPRVVIVEPSPPPVARLETMETQLLGRESDLFEQTPSAEQSARVQRAIAQLDGEIAELVEIVARESGTPRAEADRKLNDLRRYRAAEGARFLRLQALAPSMATPIPSQTAVTQADGTLERVGEKLDKAGDKIQDAARAVGDAVRD